MRSSRGYVVGAEASLVTPEQCQTCAVRDDVGPAPS